MQLMVLVTRQKQQIWFYLEQHLNGWDARGAITRQFSLFSDPESPKNGVRRPSWIFIFVIFHHMAHLSASIRVYMSNFMTIGLTVQKLLAFTFSIGNALKVPKIGVFRDFRGENRNIYLSNPRKAPPWPKTRVLRYYSSKSVYGFD